MKVKLALLVIVAILVSIISPGVALAQTLPPFTLETRGAILMDAASGQVLFNQNGDEPLVPASLVKIMTLRLAWKALKEGKVKPDDIVTVSQNAWASNPKLAGSSLMFLNVGDKVKFMDIMRGIAIPS
ncbi:MAG: D-alanyl-D-alanine carboxypeptidase, partial [Actinobacteria bacterium]|nr:D-alanyl-D-alanine carboxypeptidase [Actinomycetota bacterium]